MRKELASEIESGVVTIVSVNLESKCLLRNQIYLDFEKEPEIP